MPSVQYYNRTAPFWDFVANLEEQGASHPFFNRGDASNTDPNAERPNPWAGLGAGFPFGSFPYRGRHGAHPHQQPPPPPGAPTGDDDDSETLPEAGPSDGEPLDPPPPPFEEQPGEDGPCGPHRRGHHHGHQHGPHRHGHHGRGGHGFHGRGGGHRGRGGFGGRGRGGFHPYAAAFGPFGPFAEMLGGQLFGAQGAADRDGAAEAAEDFKPEVDVFDTAETFVVHVSLPGAKKEDVGVSWDADKSELSIAGVVYRPGDEEFLKTLALGERSVGAFERKVRLGSRANPAQVDVDGITAKMEDGVLRIEVPKLDSGYVEIKKVDIQ